MNKTLESKLLKLAWEKFGELNAAEKKLFILVQEAFSELTDSEYTLFRAIAKGKPADYLTASEEHKTLRADRIRWLCIEPEVWKLCLPHGIEISGAKIEGSLDLSFSEVNVPLRFRQCYFTAALQLQQAKLRTLDLSGTYIASSELSSSYGDPSTPTAIDAREISVTGSVFLCHGFHSKGTVSFLGATIGLLDCDGGTFTNENGYTLLAQRVNFTGSIFLSDGFQSHGVVSLDGAAIGNHLHCDSGTFTNKRGNALNAESINVTGSVHLSTRFRSVGQVSLSGATIGGDLDCSGGMIEDKQGTAILRLWLSIYRELLLPKQLSEKNTEFLPGFFLILVAKDVIEYRAVNFLALMADDIEVKGNVYLKDLKVEGRISLYNAKVGKSLEIVGIKAPQSMALDLQFAKVHTLEHAEDDLPILGGLLLNGLVYDALGSEPMQNSERHLKWLRLQPQSFFSSQSYEQLAKVFRSVGNGDEATKVLIGREDDLIRHGKLPWLSKGWKRFLGCTIAYGYRPERALLLVLGVVASGSWVFGVGYQAQLLTPTEKDCQPLSSAHVYQPCPNHPNYPRFNPFIYSLDVFLPIVDLHLKGSWLPNANGGGEVFQVTTGAWLRYYFWLHIISGWVLTTLWVAGFSGLVRNSNK